MVEFDQLWFIFQHAWIPVVYKLSSWSSKKILNCRYDIIFGPIGYFPSQVLFFHVGGTKNSQMVPNQEKMEGDQPFQSHSHMHSSLYNYRLVCRSSFVPVNRTSFVSFPGRLRNVSSTTFQSPELLNIQCGFIWKKAMQLVSGKAEFNACQVSLLWHNSFLVSLWTFQPTLVCF